MATKNQSAETTLRIKQTFAAPRERVFRAWTDPEEMRKWYCPVGLTTPNAKADLRVGGKYHITMKSPEGKIFEHSGTYREIRPPEKLVFTWALSEESCEGDPQIEAETLVTVEFHDLGGSTELILTHELFPDKETRDKHEWGWNGCLDHLKQVL